MLTLIISGSFPEKEFVHGAETGVDGPVFLRLALPSTGDPDEPLGSHATEVRPGIVSKSFP